LNLRHGLAVLGLLLSACATAPTSWPDRSAVELDAVRTAWWQDDPDLALAAGAEVGWEATGRVAGERLRQAVLLDLGLRPLALAEVRGWLRDHPDDPDLAYLEARLLQDEDRALDRFQQLARRFPGHPWIELGLARTYQLRGGLENRDAARAALDRARPSADAAGFRRLVEAYQLGAELQVREGLALIEEDAFVHGDRYALLAVVRLAEAQADKNRVRRARSEMRRRELRQEDDSARRMEVVADRVLAEAADLSGLGLDELLARFDAWCEEAALPGGWSELPRHRAGPFGELVRPELAAGGPVPAWAEQGVAILVGEAVSQPLEVLVLTGVERWPLRWPGRAEPLEVLVARRGYSSNENPAAGGTVFHGFYARRDTLAVPLLIERADRVRPLDADQRAAIAPLLEVAEPDGLLPEDGDLPRRLAAAILAGSEDAAARARELEFELLLLHEAGHLPDVLGWLASDWAFLRAVPTVLGSILRSGDPMVSIEYRAALRSLAASPHPRWALADLLRTARGGRTATYRVAYSWLLADLLQANARRGGPPLWRWDELDGEVLRAMAREALEDAGLVPIPASVVDQLLERAGG
jgi:hypothetical protein